MRNTFENANRLFDLALEYLGVDFISMKWNKVKEWNGIEYHSEDERFIISKDDGRSPERL